MRIRKYKPSDREAVRHICCETAFMGKPVEAFFADREIAADLFSKYYTDYEPEACFVAEEKGEVIGYEIGAFNTRKEKQVFYGWILPVSVVTMLLRYPAYDPASRYFVRWILFKAPFERPKVISSAANSHTDILPAHRGKKIGSKLKQAFFKAAKKKGVKRVFINKLDYAGCQNTAFFKRHGYHETDRKKTTVFKNVTNKEVYAVTMEREL